jgi:hypothetical protein
MLGTRCTARSDSVPTFWRGQAWYERPGQAFELGEPDLMHGTTAISLGADRRGPRQDDQIVKTKLLARSCLRMLDQGLEPTRARNSRNRPLERPGKVALLVKGGLDIPGTHVQCDSHRREHPLRTLTRGAWSSALRIEKTSSIQQDSPLVTRRHLRFISASNKAWTTAPFRSAWSVGPRKPRVRD